MFVYTKHCELSPEQPRKCHCQETTHAHISKDMLHIIFLTSPLLLLGQLFVDHLAQLAKQVGTEESTPSTDRDYRIGPLNISPFDW
jgi:hypothetical protein